MNIQLSLEVPGTANYIPIARHFGRELLEQMKIEPSDIFDISCVVTELVTNSVRHAHTVGGRMQMIIDCLSDRVVITVSDAGPGFRIDEIPEPGTIRPDTDATCRIGGYGIPLIKALSTKIDFTCLSPCGMKVRAEVLLTKILNLPALAA